MRLNIFLSGLFAIICVLPPFYAQSLGQGESFDEQMEHQQDHLDVVVEAGAAGVDSNSGKAAGIHDGDAKEWNGGEDGYVSVSASISEDEEEETEPPEPEDLYFYRFDNESFVTEYEAPSNKEEKEEPDFLYNPLPGHIRIVEYYAQ